MLWPTTLRIENHWTRAKRRAASSTPPAAEEQLWSGQKERHQAFPAQPGAPVDSTDARVLQTTPPVRLPR